MQADGSFDEDGSISFVPLDGQGQTGGAPIKDGKFVAENVPVGKMKVEIHGNKRTGRKMESMPGNPPTDEVIELVPPRYNFQTELTADVKKGPQDVPFHLKSK